MTYEKLSDEDEELMRDFAQGQIHFPPYFGPEAAKHPEEMRQWSRKVGVYYMEPDTPQ